MSKKQDRIDIVEKIKAAAKLYKENLVGKTFLYVFDGKYIEVIFKADNFRHLTGVESSLSAKQFYRAATKNKLQANQISDLNFSLCMNKETDEHGAEKGSCFVVASLRDEDCFSKSQEAYSVTHIFSKSNDAKKYTNLIFMDKNTNLNSVPNSVASMLELKP